MNYKNFVSLSVFLIIFFTVIGLSAEGDKNNKGRALSKTNGSPSRTHFNINNISTWIFNNGDSDIAPSGNSGFIFPKGSNKAAVFETGFVWGATVAGERRVGGSTYNQGLLPGRIDENGQREDTALDHVRIYRVRKDWATGNLSAEVADEGVTEAEVKAQYEKDWNEWPAIYGAPYEDLDGNGAYDAAVDIPGFPGADQTVWYTSNDLDPATTRGLYGSDPMGVEVQGTFWGYASQTALGNVMFRKYTIINKSPDTFDTMFVSIWSDPDLGGAGDDYSGVDVDLSLMYTYNGDADDNQYGKTPPAIGFDFFQGPIVPGDPEDVAIFNNKKRKGFKNLEASAHYFFINSDAVYSDPTLGGDYVNGTLQFHNLFRGRISATGTPFIDPTTGLETKFALAGDPITGTGWVDGLLHPPGDRRQGMVAGPFTMAAGDTQEVVVAEIAAGAFGSVDRLGAIQLLKFYDKEAQSAYDNFFKIPPSPTAPTVTISSLDDELALSWSADDATIAGIENYNTLGYTFQGYVVYQFPSKFAAIQDAKIVATYDLVDGVAKVIGDGFDAKGGVVLPQVKKFGSDSGIRRYISLDKDLFNSGLPMSNGSSYYFAVSAYAVATDLKNTVPTVLESPINVLEVIPHGDDPGITLTSFGDTLKAAHAGPSDGFVNFIVVNPEKLTGHDYEVTFEILDSIITYNNLTKGNDTIYNANVWNLKDLATGEVKLKHQLNQKANDTSPIVDGLQIRVSGAPLDFKAFQVVANANGPINPPEGGALDFDGFPTLRPTDGQQVGTGKWAFHTGDNGTRGAYSAFLARSMRGSNFEHLVPFDWEMRFTARGSWAVRAFEDGKILQVPFELWNVGIGTLDDPSDDYRVIPWFLSSGGVGTAQTDTSGLTYQLDPNDHSGSGATNDPFTPWVYWRIPADTSPGEAGYNAFEAAIDKTALTEGTYAYDGTEVIARSVLISWNGDDVSDGSVAAGTQMTPEEGTVLRMITTKPNSASDVFTITAAAVAFDATKAKEDVKEINVFPNPYYGTHNGEINKYQRFVTFNHLPAKATIRVFNLAGQLVKKVEKDDASQFARWDLTNENSLPSASGVYVVYIDMPDLGETKILKVAIIQETQILDKF